MYAFIAVATCAHAIEGCWRMRWRVDNKEMKTIMKRNVSERNENKTEERIVKMTHRVRAG